MSNLLRTAVSRKKRRYQKDGYDLDLAYITDNIIAMGFPSEGAEGIYRNPYDEVLKFLDEKHGKNYKVYNLCSEREYPMTHFYGRTARFPFDDHNAPPFEVLEAICKDMKVYLDEHEKNVAVIHCKAGKGRTGCVICCWLLYTRLWNNSLDAMNFYGIKRTYNGKGVTIPSQRRYVDYFGEYLSFGIREPQHLIIDKFIMHFPPKFFANLEYLNLTLRGPFPEKKELHATKYIPKDYFKQLKAKKVSSSASSDSASGAVALPGANASASFDLLVQEEGITIECGKLPWVGDLKFELFEKERGLGTSEKLIFSFGINTNFIDTNKRLFVAKEHLDKGLKDKRLDSKFVIEIVTEADKSKMGGNRTRRKSVLSQLLTNKSVTTAFEKFEEEEDKDEDEEDAEVDVKVTAAALEAQARIAKLAAQHNADGSGQQHLPPHPKNLIVDKFPSLSHF